ncbi:hypothetical protein SDC9_124507 [bioreactor metagenome]|uniref:Uncharacterized protein n=1 Tax=bioreactor metagenome TaxID=1076179 RepID=A0A645CKL8_9ZZZZ
MIINDKILIVVITVLKKALLSLLAVIRDSLGKMTLATDSTKTPTIIVYRLLAYCLAETPAPSYK